MKQTSLEPPSNDLLPLIHRSKKGVLLERTPEVDSQIRDALSLPPNELVRRASQTSKQDLSFIKDEALVYLIRAFFKSGDKEVADQLSLILIERKTDMIYARLNGLADADEAFSKVIETLFTHILFRDDGRGDYLQVRFDSALKRITISAFNSQLNKNKKSMLTFSDISNPEDEDINLEESFDSSDSEGNIAYPTVSIEDQVSINDALESLDEPLRTVFILRYKYLMQVESIDPNVPTLSNHFDKTPRTIRHWLKKADEILKKKQGENHE